MENKSLIILDEKSIVLSQDAKISFKDFETLKEIILENVDKYKNLVFTDETIKEAKSIKTQFNKDKKQINSLRIAIKKKLLEPYDNLEKQVKELEDLYNKASEGIEKQISDFDLRRKEELKKMLNDKFNEFSESYSEIDFIDFETELNKNEKWMNLSSLSTSKTEIKLKPAIVEEIESIFVNLDRDIKLINLDNNGARIKTVYLNNGFNLPEAKESVLGMIAKEQEEQARIDAKMENKGYSVRPEKIEAVKQEVKDENKPEVEEIIKVKFQLKGSKTKIKKIVEYIRNCDVEIENI